MALDLLAAVVLGDAEGAGNCDVKLIIGIYGQGFDFANLHPSCIESRNVR